MGQFVKFTDGTEAQILALTPTDEQWVDKGFYYPTDKPYFYRALDGVMKLYGGGEVPVIGVGCTINDKIISGAKPFIASNEVLNVPDGFDYNTFPMKVDGAIILNGNINIL